MAGGERPGYHFFDDDSAAVFAAIAGQVVPSDADGPGADAPGAIALADEKLAERPAADQRLLRVFLRAVQWLPVLRYGRRLTALPDDKRAAFLHGLERSRIPKLRAGFFGVKTFALMGYYANADCYAELGYPGPRTDAPYYQLRRGAGG